MNPVVVGAQINSALYLLCAFVAGTVTGHPVAWKLALAAMGVTYLSYIAQLESHIPRAAASWIVVASVVLGAAAGLALLV